MLFLVHHDAAHHSSSGQPNTSPMVCPKPDQPNPESKPQDLTNDQQCSTGAEIFALGGDGFLRTFQPQCPVEALPGLIGLMAQPATRLKQHT